MKKLFRLAFGMTLATVIAFGAVLTLTPEAQAGASCPPCYVPGAGGGWSLYGSCTDFSDPHCPVAYRTYRNSHTGQVCRGQFVIGNL